MKSIIPSLLLTVVISFFGCGKKVNIPNEMEQSTRVQFHISGIPLGQVNLYALVTAIKQNGDTAFNNRRIQVAYDQTKYLTEAIQINTENLTITKFLILDTNDSVYFVNPKSGSPKANLVPKALPIKFNIQKNTTNLLTLPVTSVHASENGTSYGYLDSDFGLNQSIALSFCLSIKVGQAWYDSIPGLLHITGIDHDNQPWVREIYLSKGITRINIPAGLKQYHFKVEKWGVTIEKKFLLNNIHSGDTIHLTSERALRYLVAESVFIDNGTGYIPDSKKTFAYDQNNKLIKTLYYQRSTNQQAMPLMLQNEFRFHSNSRWDSLLRYDASGQLIGFTSRVIDNGKVVSMHEKSYDHLTTANYLYSSITDQTEINANYHFINGNTLQYKMLFKKGNNAQDKAISSTGGIESGHYAYDDNINPFHQLDYDNIFLSNHSKNNIVSSTKIYSGSFPAVVPYQFTYSYTDDGYPSEVIISYKGYTSQKHSYRIKKLYQYR